MDSAEERTWTIIRRGLNSIPHRELLGAKMMKQAAVAAIFRQTAAPQFDDRSGHVSHNPYHPIVDNTDPHTAYPSRDSIPFLHNSLDMVELLLIRRAEKEGDPWSGHIAFPGGKMQPEDASPLAAAIRETQEEIDLDLHQQGIHIATLSQQRAMALGRPIPLVITPYVFELKSEEIACSPNPEVAEILWIPLTFFLEPKNRTTMTYRKMGMDWKLPCYEYQGRTVWGLTLRMIDDILARVQKELSTLGMF